MITTADEAKNHIGSRLFFAVVLVAMTGGCDARYRMLEGTVRQSGNLPCFSIEDDPDAPSVQVAAIVVSEIDASDRVTETVWTADYTLSDSPTSLSAASCIPYGADGSSPAVGPVVPVIPGRRYTVFVNAHVKVDDEWRNRRYRSHFCIEEGALSSVVVHQVGWNKRVGERDWDACRFEARAESVRD